MRCRACAGTLEELLDLGPQPVTNRYLTDPAAGQYLRALELRQCGACGLVQLGEPFPPGEVRPRHAWITYREPEGHLDRLAERLRVLPGLKPSASVAGVTFKDDSLLERLKQRGLRPLWRLDPARDLGVSDPRAGIETLQERLTLEAARALAGARGRADVVLARHILEHAYDTKAFVWALLELVAPDGYLVLEVPDCRRSLEKRDYGAVWEEHVLYFTPETFSRSLAWLELEAAALETYPYSMEDSLVAIARPRRGLKAAPPPAEVLAQERDRARAYARALPEARRDFRKLLEPYQGQAAVFGAGHRTATLVHMFGLKDLLAFAADDDPNKRGLHLPGSGLPILPSAELLERGVRLCLLCLSPESEEKVVRNNRAFLERGGTFVSVFPDSPRSWTGATGAQKA